MVQTIQEYNSTFFNMTKGYDMSNNNILRKLIHSYDVARTCYCIACEKGLNQKSRNLCYLIGLFHDIGRFEQWKKYKTYDDKKSVDHGDLSFEILNNIDCEKLFYLRKKETQILKESIKHHTKPVLSSNKEINFYSCILKNADAFCNVVSTSNGIQQMTTTKNGVTEKILADFNAQKLLISYSPLTKLDRCLLLSACCYYVKESYLRQEILECHYMDIIYETFSKYLNKKDKQLYKQAIENLKQNYKL